MTIELQLKNSLNHDFTSIRHSNSGILKRFDCLQAHAWCLKASSRSVGVDQTSLEVKSFLLIWTFWSCWNFELLHSHSLFVPQVFSVKTWALLLLNGCDYCHDWLLVIIVLWAADNPSSDPQTLFIDSKENFIHLFQNVSHETYMIMMRCIMRRSSDHHNVEQIFLGLWEEPLSGARCPDVIFSSIKTLPTPESLRSRVRQRFRQTILSLFLRSGALSALRTGIRRCAYLP